jgi:Xaa-Pro aminopeptidase
MKKAYPMVSLNERDRRWKRTKDLMKQKGLDCLLVFGKGREHYDSYLANEYFDGIVVFPLVGDPVYLIWSATRVLIRLEPSLEGETWWIKDLRVGYSGEGVVKALQEKGMDQAKIGVVGLESWGPGEDQGVVPYKLWADVLKALPQATFTEVTSAFAGVMLVKSEEELNMIRRSAQIGELACKTMLKVTKPGVSEAKIYSEVMSTIYAQGAVTTPEFLILKSGRINVSWGSPIWTHRGGAPRAVKKGDIVHAETFPVYAGFETQQQMAVALAPVDPANEECAEVARRSYVAGVKALRPGITFKEVCDAMYAPLLEKGYWNLTPLIHSMMPLLYVSMMTYDTTHLPGAGMFKTVKTVPVVGGDLVIKEGMVMELEPNACKGMNRVNIGGTVIVTKNGAEELNKLAAKMRVKE